MPASLPDCCVHAGRQDTDEWRNLIGKKQQPLVAGAPAKNRTWNLAFGGLHDIRFTTGAVRGGRKHSDFFLQRLWKSCQMVFPRSLCGYNRPV